MAWRIQITLAEPTPTLNSTLRMHWRDLRRYERALAWEVRLALGGNRPSAPLQRARLTIERRSHGIPDEENAIGGTKWLVDTLLVPQRRGKRMLHRCGLGLIVDDDPAHLVREFRSVRVSRAAEQCTVVTIEDIAGDRRNALLPGEDGRGLA